MTKHESLRKIEPRGMSRIEAAAYVGVSPSMFDAMVKDGRMPQPKRINSRVVWDRQQLDAAFEDLPDVAQSNPWDEAAAWVTTNGSYQAEVSCRGR